MRREPDDGGDSGTGEHHAFVPGNELIVDSGATASQYSPAPSTLFCSVGFSRPWRAKARPTIRLFDHL